MQKYGKLSARFLVSSVKDIHTVGFLSFFSSFTRTTIKIPLKFPAFTFNKLKGWSISASNTKANSAVFILKGGGHLNFIIPQGITKILLTLKIDKTFKISRAPLQVKNDTSLKLHLQMLHI